MRHAADPDRTIFRVPHRQLELAKADLVARIYRALTRRRVTPAEAAALLDVPTSELPTIFDGRLGTLSFEALLRMLTVLGDGVEIVIRPQKSRRGYVRVLQTVALGDHDDLAVVRPGSDNRSSPAAPSVKRRTDRPSTDAANDDDQFLDKWKVEKLTSLDITTIYRKIKVGTFPAPIKISARRVAWRRLDILRWQEVLRQP